jgi:pSer/pThr/pTyr-binding forkhead associated (FHA) protein
VARHSLAVNILRLSLAMPRRATLGSQSIPTTVLLLLTPALDQKYGVADCVKVVLDLVAQSIYRDIQDSGRYKQLIARWIKILLPDTNVDFIDRLNALLRA